MVLEFGGHVIVFSIFIQRLLQFFQRLLEFLDLDPVRLRLLSILIQEKIKVDRLVKLEPGIVLYKLLFLHVKVDTIQLEQHDVWRPAQPSLKDLPLTLYLTLVPLDLRPTAPFPSVVQISLIYPQLDRPHLVNILIRNSLRTIRVDCVRKLHLAPEEVLPN